MSVPSIFLAVATAKLAVAFPALGALEDLLALSDAVLVESRHVAGRPEHELEILRVGPHGRPMAGQPEGVVAALIEVAEHTGRDRQIDVLAAGHGPHVVELAEQPAVALEVDADLLAGLAPGGVEQGRVARLPAPLVGVLLGFLILGVALVPGYDRAFIYFQF